MVIQKQYTRRNIEGYVSPYSDPLLYRSISELSDELLLTVYGRALHGTHARDLDPSQAAQELQFTIQFAEDAFHPETWVVAYDGENPVGVVFAQRYADKLEEGSLFFIGVLPEHRGKGLGRILHAKGLEMLAAIGVKEYVGSTDVLNTPMIEIFRSNGCRLYAIRDIEIKVGIVQ